jgi:hypothetical protein
MPAPPTVLYSFRRGYDDVSNAAASPLERLPGFPTNTTQE